MSYQVRTSRAELEWTGSLLTRSDERGHRERIVLEPQDAYQGEISYFANCCAHGRQPELCPPTASANAVKLALLLNESRAAGGAQLKCSV